jgi:hypothetical protein
MLKRANGDDDEKGRRKLTDKDRAAVAAYMAKRPKGQEDEKFHAFVEAKGINPHGAEEAVYDLLGAKLSHAIVKLGLDMGYKPPPLPKPKGMKTPAQRLRDAQDIGDVGAFDQKTQGIQMQKWKPLSMAKQSFAVSQYSGPLGPGRMNYRNQMGMPAQAPAPMKVAGPPPPGEEEGTPAQYPDEKRASLAQAMRVAIATVAEAEKLGAAVTPAQKLQQAGHVGLSGGGLKPAPGPSIAQIAKPSGYGLPAPGATKAAM